LIVLTMLFLGCTEVAAENSEEVGGSGGQNAIGSGADSFGGSAQIGAASAGGNAQAGGTSVGAGSSGAAGTSGGRGGNTSASGPSDAGSSDTMGGPTRCVATEPSDTAPASTWVNATGNLANMPAGCGTLARVAAKPCSKTLIAGVADHGLWQSDDSGQSWRAIGKGAGSASITNNPLSIVFDPIAPDHFWESGLFGGGGLYASTDAGQTFKQLGMRSMVQLVSVDFSDPDRKTVVFGTHGEKQQLYRSTNGGQDFQNIGGTLPADAHSSESPIVINSQTYLLGACGTNDTGVCGIFRTTDAGASWSKVSALKVSHYGAPLWASNGAIYWPMLFSTGIAKSTDSGKTWIQVTSTVKDVTPVELPDGSVLSVGKDHVVRSTDGGATWQPIGNALPFAIDGGNNGGVTYSARRKTMYVWHLDCGSSVAPDAIMSAGLD